MIWSSINELVNNTSLIILISTILLLYFYHYMNHPTKTLPIPSGPIGLPVVGVLPWMFYYNLHNYALRLSKTFGKIFTLTIGKYNMIIINDYDMAKEFSMHPDFQGRHDSDFLHETAGGLGIVSAEGTLWKHQRRFTVQALKDVGMGKLHLQDKILDEISKMFMEIDKMSEKNINLHGILQKATCNIICALAFGKQYQYDDLELNTLIRRLNYNFKVIAAVQVSSASNWLYPLMKLIFQKKINKNSSAFKEEGKKFIEEHKQTLDVENPRDLIDLYLIEMQKKSENDAEKEYFDTFFESQLVRLIVDLFGAGTETSSTSLRWAILYMLNYPDIQEKIQKELDDVIGTERMARIEDKPRLPFTVATMQEIERLACVATLSLPRSNANSAEFKGFRFPPRQVFHINIFKLHRDPAIWNEPEVFNPERFIENGKAIRPVHLMPFGSGKRICPGEGLAKAEVFLFFANLLLRYRFEAADPDNVPPMKETYGFVRGPIQYVVKAHKRF